MSYINSLSQTQFLQAAIKNQNQELTTLQQIVSSGGQKSQDFSGFTPTVGNLDLKVRGQIARNSAYQDTIATLATRTQAIETSLTSADSAINSLANTITQLNTQDPSGTAVQGTAENTLEQIIAQFNATSDGVPLFSGVALNSNNAPSYPIADTTSLMGLLSTANLTTAAPGGDYPFGSTAGSTPQSAASDAISAITSIFDSPSNTSTWFVPGASGVPAAPAQIADDQTVQASITANPNVPANGSNTVGTAIQNTLAIVTAVATLGPSNFANQADYDQFLVQAIGQINSASTDLNGAVAVNGIVRGALGTAQTVTDTSTNLLQQALDTNENQDLTISVTNLNNLQTQLQATYQITAQLKGLSLANFLPT
jgi:flagellar hook-associated protein 3 FlgL